MAKRVVKIARSNITFEKFLDNLYPEKIMRTLEKFKKRNKT